MKQVLFFAIATFLLLSAACGGVPEIPAEGELHYFHIEPFCEEEIGAMKVTAGEAYDPTAPGPHTMAVFYQIEPEGGYSSVEKHLAESYKMPEAWLVETNGNYRSAEIVACVSIVEGAKTDIECEYGDEESDGYILTGYDSALELNLIALDSGELIASQTFEAAYEECPLLSGFYNGKTTKDYASPPWEAVADFLSDYVE